MRWHTRLLTCKTFALMVFQRFISCIEVGNFGVDIVVL